MNKKGFTLIELLAVIVILAIIALIATPIVLNIIKDTRESAGLRSAEMYLEAVEQAVSIEKMNNTSFNPSTCTIKEDGNLTCEGTDVQVEVKGEKPLKGNIVFESGKIIKIRLEYKNNKIILKNEKGNLEYFDYNRNSDINFVVEGIKEQKTTTGKNLYSGGDVEFTAAAYNLNIELPAGTYTFSAIVDSTDTDATRCLTSFGYIDRGKTTRTSITTTLTEDTNIIKLYSSSDYANGVGDTATFKDIQIEAGEEATEYEEYTGGKPSPSPEYPQEIPLAGTLNTKTGKYDIGVTASIEGGKSQTLTLTSPVKLTKWDKLVKRDGVWGWSVNSLTYTITGNETFGIGNDNYTTGASTACIVYLPNKKFTPQDNVQYDYIDRLSFVPGIWGKTDGSVGYYSISNYTIMRFRNEDMGITDDMSKNEKDECFRSYLKSLYENGNPVIIAYETDTEQAFHPLPDEEQNLLYNLKF